MVINKNMTRKLNPNIIRVGDWVEIINPEFVIRCGYPLTFEDARNYIKKEFITEINEFKIKLENKFRPIKNDVNNKFKISLDLNNLIDDKLTNKIVNAIAYDYLRYNRFGGNERKLYIKQVEECKGEICLVSRIKIVKTGKYFSPSGGYDSYSGEYDYEPGGLTNEKTHKLLEICHCIFYQSEVLPISKFFKKQFNEPCIEVCNVKKVIK